MSLNYDYTTYLQKQLEAKMDEMAVSEDDVGCFDYTPGSNGITAFKIVKAPDEHFPLVNSERMLVVTKDVPSGCHHYEGNFPLGFRYLGLAGPTLDPVTLMNICCIARNMHWGTALFDGWSEPDSPKGWTALRQGIFGNPLSIDDAFLLGMKDAYRIVLNEINKYDSWVANFFGTMTEPSRTQTMRCWSPTLTEAILDTTDPTSHYFLNTSPVDYLDALVGFFVRSNPKGGVDSWSTKHVVPDWFKAAYFDALEQNVTTSLAGGVLTVDAGFVTGMAYDQTGPQCKNLLCVILGMLMVLDSPFATSPFTKRLVKNPLSLRDWFDSKGYSSFTFKDESTTLISISKDEVLSHFDEAKLGRLFEPLVVVATDATKSDFTWLSTSREIPLWKRGLGVWADGLLWERLEKPSTAKRLCSSKDNQGDPTLEVAIVEESKVDGISGALGYRLDGKLSYSDTAVGDVENDFPDSSVISAEQQTIDFFKSLKTILEAIVLQLSGLPSTRIDDEDGYVIDWNALYTMGAGVVSQLDSAEVQLGNTFESWDEPDTDSCSYLSISPARQDTDIMSLPQLHTRWSEVSVYPEACVFIPTSMLNADTLLGFNVESGDWALNGMKAYMDGSFFKGYNHVVSIVLANSKFASRHEPISAGQSKKVFYFFRAEAPKIWFNQIATLNRLLEYDETAHEDPGQQPGSDVDAEIDWWKWILILGALLLLFLLLKDDDDEKDKKEVRVFIDETSVRGNT